GFGISKYDIYLYMKSLLIQLDEPILSALDRVAPPAQRKRAAFIRAAIRKAIMEAEEERTRLGYLKQPDSEAEAADWSTAEAWETRAPKKHKETRRPLAKKR